MKTCPNCKVTFRASETDCHYCGKQLESLVGVASTALFAVDCWAYGSADEPTISKALAENRVVKITPTEDGKFEVLEMCDEYFGATLTAEQLAEWGRELIALSSANVQEHTTPRNEA